MPVCTRKANAPAHPGRIVLDNQAEAVRRAILARIAQLEESIEDEDTATRIHSERPDLLEAGMVSEGD